MNKAVVYARYSSDSQTEQSIEGQVRVCNEYAEKNGIKILEYYVDRAMTGTNDNRPDFKRMLEDSKKKLWDCILVYRFDRFSRNKYESVIHKKNLKDLGISVVSAMENIPNTPEGIILESLLEGLNQYYSAELSQKVKRGLRESRIKGNYHGGPRPYGYHVIDKKLVIDEKEAKIVRYIFKQYLLGHYGTGIAKKLNRKGLRYMTGKPFNSDHVCSIINKEYYTGMYFHDGEYFHNIYPPIVERNIFRKALERKSLFCCRQYFREAFAFRNKIVCKQCGARFRIDGTEKKYVYKYYKCTTRKKDKTACSASQYRKTYLEDYLISFIKSFMQDSNNIETIINILLSKYKQKKNLDQLKIFENEKIQCENSLKNLIQAVENGLVNDTTNNRIKILEDRLVELKAEIFHEQNKDDYKYSKRYIRKFYSDSFKLDNCDFVNYLIDKIIMGEETTEIYLNCPYNNKYSTFELIKKDRYEKSYPRGKTYLKISKEISVFI